MKNKIINSLINLRNELLKFDGSFIYEKKISFDEIINEIDVYVNEYNEMMKDFEFRHVRWIDNIKNIDPIILSIIIHLENKKISCENELEELKFKIESGGNSENSDDRNKYK